MFYGRKGLTLATISVVDLAIWDLLGKIRGEPVYKRMGFWGGKVPLPHGPHAGPEGLRKNVAFLKGHREAVGPDFPIMVDCYMSLNVQYAIELAQVSSSRSSTSARDLTIRLLQACIDEKINIHWWEEVLHPDDFDGHKLVGPPSLFPLPRDGLSDTWRFSSNGHSQL
jgi:L-rhamnonate dehydratase